MKVKTEVGPRRLFETKYKKGSLCLVIFETVNFNKESTTKLNFSFYRFETEYPVQIDRCGWGRDRVVYKYYLRTTDRGYTLFTSQTRLHRFRSSLVLWYKYSRTSR